MTAVILLAEALRSASIINKSSMRLSLEGYDIDCTTKISLPLTFSSIFTQLSPSENCFTLDFPIGKLRREEISFANGIFAFPEKTIILGIILVTFLERSIILDILSLLENLHLFPLMHFQE